MGADSAIHSIFHYHFNGFKNKHLFNLNNSEGSGAKDLSLLVTLGKVGLVHSDQGMWEPDNRSGHNLSLISCSGTKTDQTLARTSKLGQGYALKILNIILIILQQQMLNTYLLNELFKVIYGAFLKLKIFPCFICSRT